MNLFLKQILIIGTSFLIILWFQNIDDKKNNRQRTTIYEQYKFPSLVAAIVGLLINLPEIINSNSCQLVENVTDITVVTPVKSCDVSATELGTKPFINNNNFGMNIDNDKLSWFNTDKNITNQQIFTEMPDF
jgi:hypothetical protein